MASNILIQQYGKHKREDLDNNPYSCLLNTNIDLNPHQVDAFYSAIKALKTGGIILADEVGLGKTIEAGLIIKYVVKSGGKKILISLPKSLLKQWEIELKEKFDFTDDDVKILDQLAINYDPIGLKNRWLMNDNKLSIALTTYAFSSKLIKMCPTVKWDFLVIDEAHHMRNVFHGTKRAKALYNLSHNIPKILLTATPLQNNLSDLHGLVSFIDERIFGTEAMFKRQYLDVSNYDELKEILQPVLYRTLRKDVNQYMQFAKREARTFDFRLSAEEVELYMRVNAFLKRDDTYSFPEKAKKLMLLVIRKLLASSSFALVETFEVIERRLSLLVKGTKNKDAQEGFDLLWKYLDDDIDEIPEEDDSDIRYQQEKAREELEEVRAMKACAENIKTNAKMEALIKAINVAFTMQKENGIAEKVVIFTESKRTQKYIERELIRNGINKMDIVLFNGDNQDPKIKQIHNSYMAKNYGKVNYGPSVEIKHAIVDYFEHNGKILVLTDAGSEGLNLQFCNTVINYDLPWNPMKIEQRIGRCHRYGQKNDVIAMNFLNIDNEADKRVYEILSEKFKLFEGVFGASDKALGVLESGMNFEQEVLDIYQRCNSTKEFDREFDKLDRKIEGKRNKDVRALRDVLMTKSSEEKCKDLDRIKKDIDKYLWQVDYWNKIELEDLELPLINYWKIKNWGEEVLGSHGYLFIGNFLSNNKVLYPVMLLTDDQGNYIDFEENDLLPELETIEDENILNWAVTSEEQEVINKIYNRLVDEVKNQYEVENRKLIAYNNKKIDNWIEIQKEQLNMKFSDYSDKIEEVLDKSHKAETLREKTEWLKKAQSVKDEADKFQKNFHNKVTEYENEGQRAKEKFVENLTENLILCPNIIMKF